jgi:NTP pyrophosphatase (non-canonical NTP hydrolase)
VEFERQVAPDTDSARSTLTGETLQMRFSDYQNRAQETDQTPLGRSGQDDTALLIPLLGLAGEAGQLLTEYKKRLRDGPRHERFADRVAEELGDILWYVANLATKYGLDLDRVADENLQKTRGRYRPVVGVPANFDLTFEESERFPRCFVISLIERIDGDRVEVRTSYEGRNIGAALTDNAYADDGYRFHDVFHIAYAAVLGWSPVLRSTMKRKRKSIPKVDEVEDGGRAAVIEEGIAALVFDYARRHAFLEGVTDIDDELLSTIRAMSRHLEVASSEPSLWCSAILDGFKVWRDIVRYRGGRVMGDLDARTVTFLGPIENAIATAPATVST